jgi:hypothetical protein
MIMQDYQERVWFASRWQQATNCHQFDDNSGPKVTNFVIK